MDKLPNIIIIEDHPIMRGGLVSYFTGTRRWNVLGAVSNIEDAKILLSSPYNIKKPQTKSHNTADLLLIDIQLKNGCGMDIIPWLKTQSEKIKTPVMAIYSAYDDYTHVTAALSMGIKAYICKHRSERELENALLKTLEGKTYIDESAQIKLETNVKLINLLSKREAEILTLLKSDLSNKQIAAHLGISQRTVENILCCVYDKTGIHSRLELQRL